MITKEQIKDYDLECEQQKNKCVDGIWNVEPNRVQFKHKGLDCMIIRTPTLLHWCGYVGVPEGHKYYGKGYDDVPVDVHGGLTYANKCSGHICHMTDGSDNTWWLGFDCAHFGDFSPGMTSNYDPEKFKNDERVLGLIDDLKALGNHRAEDTYKNMNYVTEETKRLAEQLC